MEISAQELATLIHGNKIEPSKSEPLVCLSTGGESHPFQVGKNYFIRTVTHHLTGKLVAVHSQELVMTQAAWIAEDGRFMDALKSESFAEVEPFPADREVIVGRASIIDAVIINSIPTSQK